MRYILTLIISFTFPFSFLKGQTSSQQLDGIKYEILDTSYKNTEAIQAIFYENNGAAFWNLRNEISNLDFDHCNHSFLFLLYVDSSGKINNTQMLKGSTLASIDSIVNEKVNSIENVIPVNYNGASRRALIILRFRYFSKRDESGIATFGAIEKHIYLYKKVTVRTYSLGSTAPPTNECEDDLFFYNEGIKCYNSAKYNKAIYNFTQALEVNPRDIEAQYYLGLSYQKDDNLKKACKCFSEGVQKGHENSIKSFKHYCTDIPEK